MKRNTIYFLLFFSLLNHAEAQLDITYQKPPEPIKSLATAPATPAVIVSPDGLWLAILDRPEMPSIAQLSQPELRIAGLRINPGNNGPSRSRHYSGITLRKTSEPLEIKPKELEGELQVDNVKWSPDSRKLAFTIIGDKGISLSVYDLDKRSLITISENNVNDAIGSSPYQWLSDSYRLIYKTIDISRTMPPDKSRVPAGPIVQETSGRKAPSRTYQDLLQNKYDEDLFKYYTRSQLVLADLAGEKAKIGDKGILYSISTSPDGNYILVQKIHEPFSYMVPYYRFPLKVEIWNPDGDLIEEIADIPLAEEIPIGFNAVRKGPRSFTWRSDKPADLYWVEALDEGDPAIDMEYRDQLFHKTAPFNKDALPSIKFNLRYSGITWGDDDLAIVNEYWWSTRQIITSSFNPELPQGSKIIIYDRSYEDRYNDPGSFQTKYNVHGKRVLHMKGNSLYLFGTGASPEGNRPFVDMYSIKKGTTSRIWRSEAPWYERPIKLIDSKKEIVLTYRESSDVPANVFLRDLKKGKISQLTSFTNPYEALKGIEKHVIHYERADGLPLKGDLYLPAGYKKEDGPIPVIMWAYPDEFKSKDAAGQVTGSPYQFIRLYYGSPLFWVTRGYAIFDDISMPVVGVEDEEPNDTFVPQLVTNAEAAINKLVEMGVADKKKIAIGGHSYGAFMTANLLAHSDLFAAGIARSGAYNRSLTPFGFQAEERTFWEAPEVYFQMSPFMHADKVNEPILLIHGEADNNSGTFPIQSKRFYNAIKGHGGTARLVMLPNESHGYRSEESVLHMLWEMDRWLEKYVKNQEENNF
jgi:dipeptidyl aminopeptidase/acylaminoacyl peptidase